jgi:hypothetical protein
MEQDLSYLRTEYARDKMIEEYRNEEKEKAKEDKKDDGQNNKLD